MERGEETQHDVDIHKEKWLEIDKWFKDWENSFPKLITVSSDED